MEQSFPQRDCQRSAQASAHYVLSPKVAGVVGIDAGQLACVLREDLFERTGFQMRFHDKVRVQNDSSTVHHRAADSIANIADDASTDAHAFRAVWSSKRPDGAGAGIGVEQAVMFHEIDRLCRAAL